MLRSCPIAYGCVVAGLVHEWCLQRIGGGWMPRCVSTATLPASACSLRLHSVEVSIHTGPVCVPIFTNNCPMAMLRRRQLLGTLFLCSLDSWIHKCASSSDRLVMTCSIRSLPWQSTRPGFNSSVLRDVAFAVGWDVAFVVH